MSVTPRTHEAYSSPSDGLDPSYKQYLLDEVAKLPPEFDSYPLREDYAVLPLHQAYDLPGLFSRLKDEGKVSYGEHHGIAFCSERYEDIPDDTGAEGDYWAHLAARITPGYKYYCKGPIFDPSKCLSFCIWENEKFAKLGSSNPAHDYARSLAPQMYKMSVVEFLKIDYQPNGLTIADKRPPHVIDYQSMTATNLAAEDGTYYRPVFIPIGDPESPYPLAA